jgi:hypothetical protein
VVAPKGSIKNYLRILPDIYSGLVRDLARISHVEIQERQSPDWRFALYDFPGGGQPAMRCFTSDAGISQQISNSPASKSHPRITSVGDVLRNRRVSSTNGRSASVRIATDFLAGGTFFTALWLVKSAAGSELSFSRCTLVLLGAGGVV